MNVHLGSYVPALRLMLLLMARVRHSGMFWSVSFTGTERVMCCGAVSHSGSRSCCHSPTGGGIIKVTRWRCGPCWSSRAVEVTGEVLTAGLFGAENRRGSRDRAHVRFVDNDGQSPPIPGCLQWSGRREGIWRGHRSHQEELGAGERMSAPLTYSTHPAH